MTEFALSSGEKTFICHGVEDDMRMDGRKCFEYRDVVLETDLEPNCHGSAHVRLANTDVLVGVKVEMAQPAEGAPAEGRIEFFADCSANASPSFEGRGGQELVDELVSTFTHTVPPCLDLRSFSVVPSKHVWLIYVDILILECGSRPSLFDATSVAVKAALYDTKVPKVTINPESEEIELMDDPFEVLRLNVERIPLFVTFTRIASHYIVDATREEEAASISSILLAIDPIGAVVHVKKLGCGSLLPAPLKEVLKTGTDLAVNLHRDLMAKLTEEKQASNSKNKVGFLM